MAVAESVKVTSETPFIRKRITWLSYSMMAYFGFGISLLGPLMPFIAAKLNLTFTEVGYHFMLGGVGGLTASFTGEIVANRIGYNRAGWVGALLTAVALVGIVYGTSLEMTLFFTLLYSIGGGFVILITTATLAETHPQHSAKAFTEANIGGGIGTIIGPIMIGLIAASAVGWEGTAFTRLIFLGGIALVFHSTPLSMTGSLEHQETEATKTGEKLPPLFWVFGVLLLLGVAIEFLMLSWSANFLTAAVGFSPTGAASLVSVFAVAVLIGRMIGSRLLDTLTERQLLLLSLISLLLSFPIFWLSTVQWLNVFGLFLFGLGVSNVNPLIQAGAMATAGQAKNRASARLMFFPSIGNLVMLQLVGILSDWIGINRAFGVELILVVLAIIVVAGIMRWSKA